MDDSDGTSIQISSSIKSLRENSQLGTGHGSLDTTRIYSLDDMKYIDLDMPNILADTVREILDNAVDNSKRADESNIPFIMKVEVTENGYIVSNTGPPIKFNLITEADRKNLTQQQNGWFKYKIEMAFGGLNASGNFGDNSGTAGMHGMGAYITNIFSKTFVVRATNKNVGKELRMQWSNSTSGEVMYKPTEENVTGKKANNKVIIAVYPEFNLRYFHGFNLKDLVNRGVFIQYITNQLRSNAFYIKKSISLQCRGDIDNSRKIEPMDMLRYLQDKFDRVHKIEAAGRFTKFSNVELYMVDTKSKRLEQIESGKQTKQKKKQLILSLMNARNDHQDYILINGLTFVKATVITNIVSNIVNGVKRDREIFTPDMFRRNTILVFVATAKQKLDLNNQSKDRLSKPCQPALSKKNAKSLLGDDSCLRFKQWSFMQNCNLVKSPEQATREAKILIDSSGSYTRNLKLTRGFNDANYAAMPGKDTTLVIFEGLSAMQFWQTAISKINLETYNRWFDTELSSTNFNARDHIGLLAAQGKVVNAVSKKKFVVLANKFIVEFNKAIGWSYVEGANNKKLRYTRIVLAMDADPDGGHIACLLLAYFYKYCSKLLSEGLVYIYNAPYVMTKTGNYISKYHYNTSEDDGTGYMELKGLGSIPHNIIQRVLNTSSMSKIDNNIDPYLMESLMGKESARRYEMLKNMLADETKFLQNHVKVLTSKNIEFNNLIKVLYSIYLQDDSLRSMPDSYDGLITSRRMAIWAALHYLIKQKHPIKTTDFVGTAMGMCGYEHGDTSMTNVIEGLCGEYSGGMTLPLLEIVGITASRQECGKDGPNARYTHIKTRDYLTDVFKDVEFVNHGSDNTVIQGTRLNPIVPLLLFMNTDYLGTGVSSSFPSYNPFEIIDLLLNIQNNDPVSEPYPYYRNWNGIMVLKGEDDGTVKCRIKPRVSASKAMRSGNEYHYNQIVITNIPPAHPMSKFRARLSTLREEHTIQDFSDRSAGDLTHFTVIKAVMKDTANTSIYNLHKDIPLTNMRTVSENNIHSILSIRDYCRKFLNWRIPIYQKRKDMMLNKLKEDLKKKTEIIKAIELTENGTIVTHNKSISEVENQCTQHEVSADIVLSLTKRQTTSGALVKLKAQIEVLSENIEATGKLEPEEMWRSEIIILRTKLKSTFPDIFAQYENPEYKVLAKFDDDPYANVKSVEISNYVISSSIMTIIQHANLIEQISNL